MDHRNEPFGRHACHIYPRVPVEVCLSYAKKFILAMARLASIWSVLPFCHKFCTSVSWTKNIGVLSTCSPELRTCVTVFFALFFNMWSKPYRNDNGCKSQFCSGVSEGSRKGSDIMHMLRSYLSDLLRDLPSISVSWILQMAICFTREHVRAPLPLSQPRPSAVGGPFKPNRPTPVLPQYCLFPPKISPPENPLRIGTELCHTRPRTSCTPHRCAQKWC